jgi:hypothetical protein
MPPTRKKGSKRLETIKALSKEKHEYGPASPRDFPHLDLAFYDRGEHELGQLGFRSLGDWENLTVSGASAGALAFTRTFIRLTVSRDGLVAAALYHARPRLVLRFMLSVLRKQSFFKNCEFETEYSDGSFLVTTNSNAASTLRIPPAMIADNRPHSTAIATLSGLHRQRMNAYGSLVPSIRPTTYHNADDVLASQHRQQALRAAYWKQIRVISREELAELSRKRDNLVTQIHEAVHGTSAQHTSAH